MSRIETLPADQRAVLQLLLRQGRRYDELSGLLRLDEAAVRRRAHDALASLGPDATAEIPAERRNEIADYLLGQDGEEQRLVTYGFLEGSAGARAWARVVAGELRELAGDGLPAIPAEGRDDVAPAPEPPPAAVAQAAPVAPASAPAATGATAVVPAAGATTATATSAGAATSDAPAADRSAPSPADPDDGGPRLPGPRSSRLGGALLLGGIAIAAVAAALFFLVFRSDDSGGGAKTAGATTATQPQGQVEAQVNLVPPGSRKSLKALGVVLVQRAQGQSQIVAAVQGLPKPKSGGYGIWLYSGPGKAKWLGFFASRDDQGRLLARGRLTVPIADYREVLVTREGKGNPARPGSIFLRGPVQAPSAAGG